MNLNNTQLIDWTINIIGVSIPALITYMVHYIRLDKNWRDRKGKSSFDKYTIYLNLFSLSIHKSANAGISRIYGLFFHFSIGRYHT